MQTNIPLSEMPAWTLALLGVLVVVQIGVEIFAIVKLLKTPDERLVFGKKWPWLLIILFVNLVGALVFLAAGRKPAETLDPLVAAPDAPAAGDRAARAADVLYGSKGDAE